MEHMDRRRGDTQEVPERRLQRLSLFAPQQEPDIISSLTLWLEVNPQLRCFEQLWGHRSCRTSTNDTTYISLPDEGVKLDLNGLAQHTEPAHKQQPSGISSSTIPPQRHCSAVMWCGARPPSEEDALFVEHSIALNVSENYILRRSAFEAARIQDRQHRRRRRTPS